MEADSAKKAEIDPFCEWQHEQESDILMLHVKEFKKEHLKVLVNGCGTLKISGDQPAGNRFLKEVSVPPECNIDEIQAKYVNGVLHIVMPRKKISAASSQENQPKPPSQAQTTVIALKVAAAAAVVSVITAFSYYMYKSTMGD